MQARSVGNVVGMVVVAAVALCGAGCNSWPKDINVALDKRVTQDGAGVPSVDVHLIGVRAGELKRYKTLNVSDYWAPGGASRQPVPARKTLFLGPGSTSKTVSGDDPVWNQWDAKVRPYLVVLADLRGVTPQGDDDPRRVVLPLDKKRWGSGTKQIKITVQRDRIQLTTPPKPRG